LTKAGSSAFSVAVSRWVPARNSRVNAWVLYSGDYFSNFSMNSNYRVAAVALLTL